jgi:cell fate regulator YaaT (PSP1 superfamily)
MSFIDLPVLQAPPVLKPPTSLVVRYGNMRMMGEFPYDGDTRPGCGAKVVIRTKRGTELAEVVTTTCSNGGCAKSITRDKLMEYIENSGGNDYPFSTDGRIVRIATVDDQKRHSELEAQKPNYIATCRTLIRELDLPMKLVEVELLMGGEMATFFFMSEQRVDFRALVKHLAGKFRTRIQMHQVGARDEARLVADYETCGQHCCCKQFLKVLKPISMGAAKMQKATLDPNKISGRCGRLKCCLRYEETTYEELKRKLPRINSRVKTSEGIGYVEETMILTQLVKVRLESSDRILAVANEELLERDLPQPPREQRRDGQSDVRDQREPRDQRPPQAEAPRPPTQSRPPQPKPPLEEDEAPESHLEDIAPDIEEAQFPPISAPPTVPQQRSIPPEKPAQPRQPNQPPTNAPPQNRPPGMGSLGRSRRRGRGRGPGPGPQPHH